MQRELDYAKLGVRIKEARKKAGLTQEKVAEMVGCSPSHISNAENHHTQVSLNTLLAIANILGTTIDSLLCEQYERPEHALDHEIMTALESLDLEKKQKVLQIIQLL